MLIRTSTQRELLRTFSSVALVLLTCLIALMLVRTLFQASSGNSAASDVLLLLGTLLLSYFPLLLALALYIGVFIVFTRMWTDSEMSIWMVCGFGLHQFIPTVLRLAIPVTLVIAVGMSSLWPRMAQMSDSIRSNFESRSDLSRLAPGKFQESQDGSRIMFIELQKATQSPQVFFRSTGRGSEQTIMGTSGQMLDEDNRQMLELTQGNRVRKYLDNSTDVMDFQNLQITLSSDAPKPVMQSARALSTKQLLSSQSPVHAAELFWRVSLPLMALNLALLALPLSTSQARFGKSARMVSAVLLYLLYSNLANLLQAWIAQTAVTFVQALLLLHVPALLLALLWTAKRVYGLEFSYWFWRVVLLLRGQRAA